MTEDSHRKSWKPTFFKYRKKRTIDPGFYTQKTYA